MRSLVPTIALLGLSAAVDIDCSDASAWSSRIHGNGPWRVHHKGSLFTSALWVDASQEPGAGAAGSWSPWTLAGTCKAGTTHAEAAANCSGVSEWSAQTIYNNPDMKVIYQNHLYSNKWYVNGEHPDVAKPEGVWKLLGACAGSGGGNTGGGGSGGGSGGSTGGGTTPWTGTMPPSKQCWSRQFFMPFIDVSQAKDYQLSNLVDSHGVKQFVLSSVVSDSASTSTCQGKFGGTVDVREGPTVKANGQTTYLYDELVKVRQKGGDFVVAFGGASGMTLADSPGCQHGDAVANLAKEYTRVLDVVNSQRIAFNVEGSAIGIQNRETGWTHRFKAVKKMKEERNGKLHVIYTLPVLPTGLDTTGVAFIDKMMELDSPFDIINVMNGEYGQCPAVCDGTHMDACERSAMDSVAEQMYDTAKRHNKLSQYGWRSVEDVYSKLGSTPKIGQNNQSCLTYTLQHAETNVQHFKTNKRIRMLSYWSVDRDTSSSYMDRMVKFNN